MKRFPLKPFPVHQHDQSSHESGTLHALFRRLFTFNVRGPIFFFIVLIQH